MIGKYPKIFLKIDVSNKLFFERLEQIIQKLSRYRIDKKHDEFDIRNYGILQIFKISKKSALCGQIISLTNHDNEVLIKMIPDYIDYKKYKNNALTFFKPLLSEYNSKYKTKLRLSIQPESSLSPYIPPKTKDIFMLFISLVNREGLHPIDWKRFYDFVWYSHKYKVKISPEELEELLIYHKFNKEKAEVISDIYGHIREFLKYRSTK